MRHSLKQFRIATGKENIKRTTIVHLYGRLNKNQKISYRTRPSSSVPCGLNNESIISSFGDCERTEALYFETRGHSREPTTYNQNGNKHHIIGILDLGILVRFGSTLMQRKFSSILLQWTVYQTVQGIHGTHPFPRWELGPLIQEVYLGTFQFVAVSSFHQAD